MENNSVSNIDDRIGKIFKNLAIYYGEEVKELTLDQINKLIPELANKDREANGKNEFIRELRIDMMWLHYIMIIHTTTYIYE